MFGTAIETIYPVNFDPNAKELDSGLVLEAGLYNVDGLTFDLSRDGLYRFYKLPSVSEQRVVCKNKFSSASQILGYLFCYGNRDDTFHLMQNYVI